MSDVWTASEEDESFVKSIPDARIGAFAALAGNVLEDFFQISCSGVRQCERRFHSV